MNIVCCLILLTLLILAFCFIIPSDIEIAADGDADFQQGKPSQQSQPLNKEQTHSDKQYLQKENYFHEKGMIYFKQGNFAQAIDYQQKSLQIIRSIKGQMNSDAALRQYNIGVAYFQLKKYEQALRNVLKALEIRQTIYVADITKVLNLYTVGLIYSRMNNRAQAKKYLERAKQLRLGINQYDDNEVANIYYEIAQIDFDEESFAAAITNYRKCLQIKIELNGKETIENARIMSSIATSYFELQEFEKSLQFILKAIDIYKKNKVNSPIEWVNSLANIGEEFYNQEKYKQAITIFEKSLEVELNINGRRSPESRETLNSIGAAYTQLDIYGEATKYYNQAIKLSLKFGMKDQQYCYSYFALGVIYYALQNFKLAQSSFKQTLMIAHKRRYRDLIRQSASSLAQALRQQNKTDEQQDVVKKYLSKHI